MTGRMTRRALLRRGGVTAAALGAGGLLGACASIEPEAPSAAPTDGPTPTPQGTATPAGQRFDGEDLTLLVYSGLTEELYREHFVASFEQRTGASVTIDAAWTEGIARLQSAPGSEPPFGLVLTDPTQGFAAIEAGLFQQFDTSALTNVERWAPELLQAQVWDDGFGLPFHSSAMTLATNTSLRPEPYQRWGELLADPPEQGVMLYNLPYMSLYCFAAMRADAAGDPGGGERLLRTDLDGVLQFAVDNRDLVTYFWPSTTDGVNALVQGNVAAGNIHGNGLLAPMRDGEPIAGVVPDGDEVYVQLFFAVPTGVGNVDLSIAAMDHIASPEFQEALARSGEYACAIPELAAEQAERDEAWSAAFPSTAEEFANLRYYPYDVYEDNAEMIAEVWDREVLRDA
jgi:spermidine/putrescine-binding protein